MDAALSNLPKAALVTAEVRWICSIFPTISVESTAHIIIPPSDEIALINLPINPPFFTFQSFLLHQQLTRWLSGWGGEKLSLS